MSKLVDENRAGMTLAEVEMFVAKAKMLEIPGDAVIRCLSKVGGKLKQLSADPTERRGGES